MPRGISTDNRKGENKMKRNAMFAILALATAFVCSAEDDNSDEKIKRLIVGSNFYIDNPDASYRMFMNARRRCGTDTNRFARLLAEVAQTNNNWVAQDAISSLGVYGTSAQLPFLDSMATNEQHGVSAVESILQLEGVTSNSLEVADRCLSMTNVQARMERENLCLFMLDGFANAHSNSGVRNDVERCVLCFARRSGLYNEHFDGCLSVRIPGYQFSKRRLNVLRDAERNMIIRFNKAFITNAINELVSYPEADLPE